MCSAVGKVWHWSHWSCAMFPLFFAVCAEKYRPSVWATRCHAWAPEFFLTDVTPKNNEISLMWHSPNVARPTSSLHACTLQTKVQSPVAWFPSSVYHAYEIKKNYCATVGNCCVAFFVMCAAAQLIGGSFGRVSQTLWYMPISSHRHTQGFTMDGVHWGKSREFPKGGWARPGLGDGSHKVVSRGKDLVGGLGAVSLKLKQNVKLVNKFSWRFPVEKLGFNEEEQNSRANTQFEKFRTFSGSLNPLTHLWVRQCIQWRLKGLREGEPRIFGRL